MFCRSIPFGKGVLQKRLCCSGVAQLIYDACFLICTSSFFATPSACGNKNRQLKLVVQSVLRTQAIQSGTTKPIPTHFYLVPHFLRLSPTSSGCDEEPSHSPPATSYQSSIPRLFRSYLFDNHRGAARLPIYPMLQRSKHHHLQAG